MTFEILDLYHVFHTCPDLKASEEWWQKLDATYYLDLGYLERERRWASFLLLAGVAVEPVMADVPVAGQPLTPVQRFVDQIGMRWHSIAWFVDDLPDLYERLRSANVRVFHSGGARAELEPGRPLYTHPRDTHGLLEFTWAGDDGYGGTRSEREEMSRPSALGIDSLGWITVVPKNVDAAAAFYTGVLGAEILGESRDEWYGTRSVYLQIGRHTKIECAAPTGTESAVLSDLKYGDTVHSLTFVVSDLAQLRDDFRQLDIRIIREGPDQIVVAPPGAPAALARFVENHAPWDA